MKIITYTLLVTLLIFTGTAKADAIDDAEAAYKKGNYEKAIEIFRPLAEQGNASAQGYLGLMYSLGNGVPANYQEALKWNRLSAAQGETNAQFNLGIMYAKGQGVPQDYVQAYMWLNFAAIKGDSVAIQNRDIVASWMTGSQIEQAQKLALEQKKASPSILPPQDKAAVEKAWACNPRIDSLLGGYVFYLDNPSCSPKYAYYPETIYPSQVPMSAEGKRIIELMLSTYKIDLSNRNTFEFFKDEQQRRKEEFQQAEKEKNRAK